MEIIWSPTHLDKFITFGNELRLFQVENTSDRSGRSRGSSAGFMLSKNTFAQLLYINTDINFIKCISCYPKPIFFENDVLLAIGQTSGKITLKSFSSHSQPNLTPSINSDKCPLKGIEFVPKHSSMRSCNCVSWNTIEPNLLLAGLEKNRLENSLFVFDVEKCLDFSSFSVITPGLIPIFEKAFNESVYSIHWFKSHPKCFISGLNRSLKLFDLRDSEKNIQSVNTKAVLGVTVDPFHDNRVASYFENQIFIWDSRNMEKPLMNIQQSKQIVKIGWCPTRNHLLSSLITDSRVIKLHDIQHGTNNDTYFEPTAIERSIEPSCEHKISSFSWHPTQELRLLYLTTSGAPKDYTFLDRVTLNWSPTSEIIWTNGRKLLQCIDSRDDYYKLIRDVSVKMRERASLGYGLNEKYIPDEEKLKSVWKWLEMANVISQVKSLDFKKNERLIGVQRLLFLQNTDLGITTINRSDLYNASWIGITTNTKVPCYKSVERNYALRLCQWSNDPEEVQKLIQELQQKGEFIRAAGIAVFNLMLRRAIECLITGAAASPKNGGDPSYSSVAMALSGFTGEKNSLWSEMCQNLRDSFTSSYLKAIFSFLTSGVDTYNEILNDKDIKLSDRVAFACTFLPDKQLQIYLEQLTRLMINAGEVEGLLLTGISPEGLDLLQNYIEITSDVQTASLLILHSLPSPLYQDTRAMHWVESYRNILDCWRLWHQRSLFDIEWYKRLNYTETPSKQLFVTCNFCGKSVFSPGSGECNSSTKKSSSISSPNKTRIQSCPCCKKPLPRCCLCFTSLGTPASGTWRETVNESKKKVAPFNDWFSWCQSCRHGGHAKHLMDWFKEQTECPVSSCSCKCMSLDAIIKVQT